MSEQMTRDGFAILQRRLDEAEGELAKIQKYKGDVAIHQGDHWHDNPALYETENVERRAFKKVAELRRRLDDAEVVDVEPREDGVVGFGSTVEVEIDGQTARTLRVLGSAEADLKQGIISIKSPIGAALVGAREGERRTYSVPASGRGREISVHVLKIL